jgi:hypothetical protein
MVSQAMFDHYAPDGWTRDYAGRMICPHGNPIEPDLHSGHGDCGCETPLPI